MAFSPLPKTFLDDLEARRNGPVVELGCGDGAFTRLLESLGAEPLALDRRRPGCGTVASIVADVTDLPLRDRSVRLLIAANLLRHCWNDRVAALLRAWVRCVARDGRCYIFEDEPRADGDLPTAVRNYHRVQDFLRRLAPENRGALLPMANFRRACRSANGRSDATGGTWEFGQSENHWPIDRGAVVDWLRGTARTAGREADRLIRDVERNGLSYGRYWWARWSPEVD